MRRDDARQPKLTLLVKLGTIAMYADKLVSPLCHTTDVDAVRALLEDPEVVEWLRKMRKLGHLT